MEKIFELRQWMKKTSHCRFDWSTEKFSMLGESKKSIFWKRLPTAGRVRKKKRHYNETRNPNCRKSRMLKQYSWLYVRCCWLVNQYSKCLMLPTFRQSRQRRFTLQFGNKRKGEVNDSVFYDVLLEYLVASLQTLWRRQRSFWKGKYPIFYLLYADIAVWPRNFGNDLWPSLKPVPTK